MKTLGFHDFLSRQFETIQHMSLQRDLARQVARLDGFAWTGARIGPGRRSVFSQVYRDRSRYRPHQGVQECARRRWQALTIQAKRQGVRGMVRP